MWNYIRDRVTEPSTYAGLAGVAYGIGQIFDFDEAGQAGDVLGGAAQAAASGDPVVTIGAILAGVLAMFMGEKKRR